MKDKNDHIDIDLEFLDRKEPLRVAPKPDAYTGNSSGTPVSSGNKYNWKNILIIGGVVLFFVWIIYSGDNSSTSTSSTGSSVSTEQVQNNNDTVSVGEYSCSSYNASKADSLKPASFTKQQLDSEQQILDARATSLERSSNDIDSAYVDETSQYSVNSYNRQINEHNAKLEAFKRDSQSYETKLDQYNAQVDSYNNFLQTNCTKR